MYLKELPKQYKNANEVYQQIRHAYPNANITVTGHSLGGSLAQLVSAENGCSAVTFNAYGTNDILKNTGIYNTKDLNIINYGNINDPVFNSSYTKHPGRSFVTNTELHPDKIYEVGHQYNPHIPAHKIENMSSLDDAVEIEPKFISSKNNSPFQLYAEKTFTREDIANMSNEDYLKYEPQILQQLRNGQFKEQKPDYDNFVNPNTGSKKIYTKEEIAKMSADEFMKNEFEIMGQLQSIGLPDKKDLPQIRLIPTTEGGLLSTETMSLSRSSKKLRFFQTGAFLFYLLFYIFFVYYVQRASRMPAATAEPITPATFGPIACIKRKF